jgi:hypothetical protein
MFTFYAVALDNFQDCRNFRLVFNLNLRPHPILYEPIQRNANGDAKFSVSFDEEIKYAHLVPFKSAAKEEATVCQNNIDFLYSLQPLRPRRRWE